MILRKPYAFLIKHFKLINFLLAILSSFLAYRIFLISRFFNEYIGSNYLGSFYEGFYQNYISFFVYLIIFIIIFGILAVLLLFIYKKKPIKVYIGSLITYILIFIFLMYVKNTMITMESSAIAARLSLAMRDICYISLAPQALFIISFLIRGLGFNIHKFNFEQDIKELQISASDNEEVELTIKNDGTKTKRLIRRFRREFVYYIKENKFIVVLVCIVLFILLVRFIYGLIPVKYNETYKQGDSFNALGLVYQIEDSIVTNISYNGDYLGDNVYYLVVKVKVDNNSDLDYEFDNKKIRLELDNRYVYPSQDQGNKFMDFALAYNSNFIRRNSTVVFSLVFKISLDELKKDYKIKIESGSIFDGGHQINKYAYVTLRPKIIEEVEEYNTYNVGDLINFNDSYLGNTSLTINNIEILDKYIYDYEDCINNVCRTYKDQISLNYSTQSTLLVFDYEYNIDSEIPFASYSTTINKFIESFGRIKYKTTDGYHYSTINNLTTSRLKDKQVLEVTNRIKESSEVYLSFIIRDKEYLLKIK